MKSNRFFLFPLIFMIFLIACENDFFFLKKQRSLRASRCEGTKKKIAVGIIGTSSNVNLFQEGVKLAVNEINGRGGVAGREIKTIIYDDRGDVSEAQNIAEKLSKNYDVIAAIGHLNPQVVIPVSITYEISGILYISVSASQSGSTKNEMIFKTMPSDETIGHQIAEYVNKSRYKNILIFYQIDSHNKRLSQTFSEKAKEMGIEIAASRSFFEWKKDFKQDISALKNGYKFDSVLITGTLPATAYLIKQMREMGVDVPIIGTDGLDSPSLWTIAGKAAEGTIVSTVFNPYHSAKKTREFVKHFKSVYGVIPDTWSAQGYDAIYALANVIEDTGSSNPIVISSALKFLANWQGVIDKYSFTQSGDIVGKSIFFKAMKDGNFVFKEDNEKVVLNFIDHTETGSLNLPLDKKISTLDPGLCADSNSMDIIEQLFSGLTSIDPGTNDAVPELATHWKVSEDGKIYTFYLREDAKWTDGEKVTANDIVWGIKRNIKPETDSPSANLLYIIKNAQAIHEGKINDFSRLGVKAPEKFLLVFELEHPAPYFPIMLSSGPFLPLPQNTIEKYSKLWTEPENIKTNGSYKIGLWQKDIGIILQKNQGYYEAEKVKIPKIKYSIIPQSSLGYVMYKNDELDLIGGKYLKIPASELQNIRDNIKYINEYSSQHNLSTYAGIFNTNLPPVSNPLVRKAISSAIDRKLIIEALSEYDKEVASTFVPPAVFGNRVIKENTGIYFDPVSAKKLLSDAGYPDGKNFPPVTFLYHDIDNNSQIAQAIKSSLFKHLNIEIVLKEVDKNEPLAQNIQKLQPHILWIEHHGRYPDAYDFLNSYLNDNILSFFKNKWQNDEYIEILKKTDIESDLKTRKDLYNRAEQILCNEDAVVIPLFYGISNFLVNPKLNGWNPMSIDGQHIRDWYFGVQ